MLTNSAFHSKVSLLDFTCTERQSLLSWPRSANEPKTAYTA